MAVKVSVLTPLHKLEELHKLADTKASRVGISTQDLRSLLIDHSTMFQALNESTSTKVVEPPLKSRERI
jgi:indole-3-glycerol phosphate synthase